MKHTVYLCKTSAGRFNYAFLLNNSYIFPRSELLYEVEDLFLAILLLKRETHHLKEIASTYSQDFMNKENFDYMVKLNLQCWNVIND